MNDVLTADSLTDVIVATADRIERGLDAILPVPSGPEGRLFEAMRYGTMGGGKRLRPFLVRSGARMFDIPENHALRTGVAVELIHAYSLIHDDLPAMDDDDLRRGRPSCHVAFDDATAILAGDALLTLAFEVLSDRATHPDAEVRCDLVQALSSAAGGRGMVGGQMIDLEAEHASVNAALITRLEEMKTGALIAFSCEAGSILAAAPPDTRESLRVYGYEVGLAFQVTDDLLDVEGDETDLGKKVGKDAAAGKATFVSTMGVAGARKHACDLIERAMSRLDRFGTGADEFRAFGYYVLNRRR